MMCGLFVCCCCVLSLLYICCACVCIAGIRGEVAAVMIVAAAVFEPMGFITGVGGFTIRIFEAALQKS